MIRITHQTFIELLQRQNVRDRLDLAFICPSCKTRQSARDLIEAGFGTTYESVQRYLAFACVGRLSEDKGCDWSLGGLLQIHKMEVIIKGADGKEMVRPTFEPVNAHELKAT